MLTVICPIYNEEKYIADCITSIIGQDYPKERLEVLFVDGMSTDRTREIVQEYASQYSYIHLLNNPKRIVPVALNIGIRIAQGDIIIRLDAHAHYPQNYFSILEQKLTELDADNVGGVCRTLPVNNTPVCKAIAGALSSPFGMGNSYFRIGADTEREVDTVPFGCFRKNLFDSIGMFDEELIRNQDDEFNGRIIKNGGKIYLIPSVVIDYYARDTIGKVSKMFYQYGLFKPLVNKKLGKPATLRQFFPLFFVLGLILGFLLLFVHRVFRYLYFFALLAYFFLAFYFAQKKEKDTPTMVLMIVTFLTIHLSYGWGYIRGLMKILLKKDFVAKANR